MLSNDAVFAVDWKWCVSNVSSLTVWSCSGKTVNIANLWRIKRPWHYLNRSSVAYGCGTSTSQELPSSANLVASYQCYITTFQTQMFFGKHTLDKFTLEFQVHSKYTPGFHKIVFDVRIVSFAECLSRDLDDYVETLLRLFQTILTSEATRLSR